MVFFSVMLSFRERFRSDAVCFRRVCRKPSDGQTSVVGVLTSERFLRKTFHNSPSQSNYIQNSRKLSIYIPTKITKVVEQNSRYYHIPLNSENKKSAKTLIIQ